MSRDRLSSSPQEIEPRYDVVVVGSGYGGSVAAARLAGDRTVCLFERGDEWQAGTFPESARAVLSNLQITTPHSHMGAAGALFDLRLGRDMQVLVGSGLGGTSLINAGVVLKPAEVELQALSVGLSNDAGSRAELEESYKRALAILDPQSYPASWQLPTRVSAFQKAAQATGKKTQLVPVAVRFQDGPNAVGVHQRACTLCGNCVTGCNYGAKGTLPYNYLALAKRNGAQIFTGVRVRSITRAGHEWVVRYVAGGLGREMFRAPDMFVRAERVVLAAGTLGSTEILLRSRDLGLELSNMVGRKFSANGDAIGLASARQTSVKGVAIRSRLLQQLAGRRVGPTITSKVLDDTPGPVAPPVLEDCAVPAALGRGFAFALGGALATYAAGPETRGWDRLLTLLRTAFNGAYRNGSDRTLTMLAMGIDAGTGELRLVNDRLILSWIGASTEWVFRDEGVEFAEMARGLEADATYVKDPFATRLGGRSLITAHPLGGCPMGRGAETGVVDLYGRVFRGTAGTDVYEGLYVLDGAILPRPVGTNPLLTITALAERGCQRILQEPRAGGSVGA